MVRKIGNKKNSQSIGVVANPSPHTLPSSNQLEPRQQVRSLNQFMDRCPKDEATAEIFVWRKALAILKKKLGKPVGGGGGHWRVKVMLVIHLQSWKKYP